MSNKPDNAAATKAENEIEIKLYEVIEEKPESVITVINDWLENKLTKTINDLGLDKITNINEQINNHYVASVVYKELEKNLTDRNRAVTEFKDKLIEVHDRGENFVEQQNLLKEKIGRLLTKQRDCLKEYQEGAQELEEEVIDIDKQVSELESQILELKRRKSEIAEQQEVRLKEQDSTQLGLQEEIDSLEIDVTSLAKQHSEIQEQINTMPAPETLVALDSKIKDLIHHICSIFEVPNNIDPSKQAQTDQTPPIFQLDPWATEENRGLAQISIPVGIKQIILSLHIPGDKTFERYTAELYSSNGRRVWNSDKLDINGRAVVMTFNSTFFLSDDYEMRLRGRNSERNYTPIAEYYFHVNKK